MLVRLCNLKKKFFDSSKTSYLIAYPCPIQLAKIVAIDGEFGNERFKNGRWIVLFSLIIFYNTKSCVEKVNLVRSVKALAPV